MILRKRNPGPTAMMRVGMSFLIAASLSRWFLHPGARVSSGLVDGTTGFLYGVSIACLVLSLALNRRRGSAT